MLAATGLTPALQPFGLRLAALGAAAPNAGYQAMVCIFLFGGNDSANMVLATDPDSWSRYQSARNTGSQVIALAAPGSAALAGGLAANGAPGLGGVLPIQPATDNGWPAGTTPSGTGARTFALHPLMPNLQALFSQGHAAVVPNLGTLLQPTTPAQYLAGSSAAHPLPPLLFSHSDQQSTWQTGAVLGARIGWGGQLCDRLAASNPTTTFTAISVSGNAVYLAGHDTIGYQSSATGPIAISGLQAKSIYGSSAAPSVLGALLATPSPASPSYFQADYATVVNRSTVAQQQLANALLAITPAAAPPQVADPLTGALANNPVATGLQTILNLIAAGQVLGMKRQVFFLGIQGFDTHIDENSFHPRLMANLDGGLGYFYQALGTLNGADLTGSVTAFTMSDFSRTFTSNGSGTDHGWGGHHLVVGGAVKGGDFYGQYPTVGVALGSFVNPNAIYSGVWVPTTAVDQYAATLGSWMGVGASDLAAIFPNLANFATNGNALLGFL
jgi:uncharacterized protein (DUF1501 family)